MPNAVPECKAGGAGVPIFKFLIYDFQILNFVFQISNFNFVFFLSLGFFI